MTRVNLKASAKRTIELKAKHMSLHAVLDLALIGPVKLELGVIHLRIRTKGSPAAISGARQQRMGQATASCTSLGVAEPRACGRSVRDSACKGAAAIVNDCVPCPGSYCQYIYIFNGVALLHLSLRKWYVVNT